MEGDHDNMLQSQEYVPAEPCWVGLGWRTARGRQLAARIDRQFSPENTLNVSFPNFDAMSRLPRSDARETHYRLSQKSLSLAIRNTHSFPPQAVNSFVFGRSHFRDTMALSSRSGNVDPGEYGFNIRVGYTDAKGLPEVLIYSTNQVDSGGW